MNFASSHFGTFGCKSPKSPIAWHIKFKFISKLTLNSLICTKMISQMPLKKMQKRRYLLLHIFWKHLALVLLPPLKRWPGKFFSILFYFKGFYIFIFFFSDEENDAKLWTDIVESIKDWQQSKVIKIQQRNRGLHRSVLFFNFTNLLKPYFP